MEQTSTLETPIKPPKIEDAINEAIQLPKDNSLPSSSLDPQIPASEKEPQLQNLHIEVSSSLSPDQITSNKYDEIFNSNPSSPEKRIKIAHTNSIASIKTWTKHDIENDKRLLISKSSTFERKEYIQPIEWSYLDDSNFAIIETEAAEIFKSLNRKELFQLSKSIRNCTISIVANNNNLDSVNNIGPWSTLEYMVESTFFYDQSWKKEMMNHVLELEQYIFRWRSICGDGNCFYRAIIFSFLENISLTKNNLWLKELIISFHTKMHVQHPNVAKTAYIAKEVAQLNCNWIVQILYLMVEAMEGDSQIKCYEILVKSFLFCKQFDYGMIFFFRFLLFEYIKDNETKAYTQDFSVKIGNLLPSEYETESGEFLFDKFYEEQWLKMYTDAEKITIYLTPFVLKCDWNVLMYEFDQADSVSVREFKCGLPGRNNIELLFRKTHYDIWYNKEYFKEYPNEFCVFVNWQENCRVIDCNELKNWRNNKNNIESVSLTSVVLQEGEQRKNNANNINQQPMSNKDKVNNMKPNNEKPEPVLTSSSDKNAVNDPNYNIDIWKCFSCQSYLPEFDVLSQCKKCINNEIKNQIFALYLSYLSLANHEFNTSHYAFSSYFKRFFAKNTLSISNNPMQIKEACAYANLKFNDVINSIKSTICIICQNNIKGGEYLRLPCKCHLCSEKCYFQYFELYWINDYKAITKNNINTCVFKECLCGYGFSFTDYTNLYKFFERTKNEHLKKYLKETVILNWKEKCMCCMSPFNNTQFYKIVWKDNTLKDVFDVKEFNHIICANCKNREKDRKDVACGLCGLTHKIVKFKKITESDDKDCVVF